MATIQQVLVASGLFIFIMVGSVLAFTEFHREYGFTPDSNYFGNATNSTQDIDEIENITLQVQERFDDSDVSQSNLDTSVTGGLNAIKKVGGMNKIVMRLVNVSLKTLGIPTWMQILGTSLLFITITLAILSAFLGRVTER